MGYLVNVCWGELLTALSYNNILYVVLLYSFLITLLFLCVIAFVVIISSPRVRCAFDARHHVPAFTAK